MPLPAGRNLPELSALPTYDPHGPREECGVIGIYAPGQPVGRLTYLGLHALQHRGQESAGIATTDGSQLHLHKRLGLVSQVFDRETIETLEAGDERSGGQAAIAAIGHTRYSTTGSNTLPNVQPVHARGDLGELMLGHNGNLTNASWLRDELGEQGVDFVTASDTEVLARFIAHAPGRTWAQRVERAFHRATGAYTFTMLTEAALVAVRDPIGFRPLALGRLFAADGQPVGWAVASESVALDAMGAQFVRDVEAGEILTIDAEGVHSHRPRIPDASERLCIFEFVYLARPDSVIAGRLLYEARQEMGRQLAREQPADADLVIPVPDSAIPAAIGYAEESGLPYREGLIKNRYVGRTFIQPAQTGRDEAVRMKYNPLPEVLRGKRVVMVDDSIVRGTTTGPTVAMLRRAGAREVHVRIHSPQMAYPCYMGVDTGRRSELIAATHDLDGIRRTIGADTLGYLSQDGLLAAVKAQERAGFCTSCFDGRYPTQVPLELDKFALERG
ncbi:MAG TPA: amidophosphoribosyltransferase [Candidatus Limnocylindria bacterium]|nr:amidophosphoribosyltransferase [Candidatus Limnocylindria bacterium]